MEPPVTVLTVSPQMKEILAQPGYIKSDKVHGGQRLRELYRAESINLDARALSEFGFRVFTGHLDGVKDAVERGIAPPLSGTETAYETSYASLAILGAQRIQQGPPGSMRYRETLEYLFKKGMPPDIGDIVGNTALHHATTCPHPKDDLTRCLPENGANVNHQNRYGEICIMGSMQLNLIPAIDILMEYGADLDLPDADDWTARKHYLCCGPQVTALVTKWIRKRSGEQAPREEKRCDECGLATDSLKNCARCKILRYCSVECQKRQWPTHKKTCQSFSLANTVTLKPYYQVGAVTMPTADLIRTRMGNPSQTESWTEKRTRAAHVPKGLHKKGGKTVVIKVQVPWTGDPRIKSQGDLMVYNKTRDFACTIRRGDAPEEYDRISEVVRTQGVNGAKAYFSAELESKDRLVVKVSEVLAAQPW
ncbi:hypothetical protein FB45DRAFT_900330 [Roridomyces roridus]|uniref:MYND-type domain-containing protein n=1 Tax=Roridomyces roridus TaxID=1738132 RepID=A0AAD7C806_9AGAR|nr:hypothetical protein FB45DRAFT_900330 [Roridomyces roridus]